MQNHKSKTCPKSFDSAQDKHPRRIQNRKSLELVDRNPEGPGRINKSAVVARDRNALPLSFEKIHRCQMQGIKGADWFWERLQGPQEYRRTKFNKSNAAQEGTRLISMRSGEFKCMHSSPDFIFKQTAGNQIFLPQPLGWHTVFCEKVSQGDRGIKIDHLSLRSCSISRSSSRKGMTGLRGGGSVDDSVGGVIQPWRTASASKASARSGLRFFWGGASSATTRSRSVTSTVSPLAARRTYSLSLFLRTFNPTALISHNVASRSYNVKRSIGLVASG